MKNTDRARKLREAGILRHGSEAAWREFQRQSANKSRRNAKGTAYFSTLKKKDPAKLKELSKKALQARWGKAIERIE